MIHIHALDGCAPSPLAHYLKALGVLRLVAEQADAQARGWWEGDGFRLATRLDTAALVGFFRTAYKPTPIFNPWGGRSGFYKDGSESAARKSLTAIERSTSARLATYRQTIEVARSVVGSVSGGKKPGADEKLRLVAALRKQIRGAGSRWLDAVVAIVATQGGTDDSEYPAIFGTGGNEGSGSYTSAYMSAVVTCVVEAKWDHAIEAALFGQITPRCDSELPMGQFLPEGDSTPWDLLFAFEGACLLRSTVVAKRVGNRAAAVASPFALKPAAFGYASSARLDEFVLKQGKELPGRGEQWFPIWGQPLCVPELSHLFAEGRAAHKRQRASDGWSMSRAASTFGVRRGITAFIRYGYMQRNNLASHFAVPVGRFKVADSPSPQSACLDDLDAWFVGLRRQAKLKQSSAGLRAAAHELAEALYEVNQHPAEPSRWQSVLLALAAVEAVMRRGSGFKAQPVPALRPEWVPAADDGSAEFRLALAFALQVSGVRRDNGKPIDPIRRHWLPLDDKRPSRFATTGDVMHQRLDMRPDVVMQGRDGVADAIALLERRQVEASRGGSRVFGLQAAHRAAATPSDLSAWLAGSVDPSRTLSLARALMALDRELWPQQIVRLSKPAGAHRWPDDAWMALRLAHLPWPLPNVVQMPADPAVLRRLASGDAAAAVELALRRLRSAGLHCSMRAAAVPANIARLWAAALAFPVSSHTAQRFARRLDPTFAEEQTA